MKKSHIYTKFINPLIKIGSVLIFILLSINYSHAQTVADMGVVWQKTYGKGNIKNIKANKAKDGYIGCGTGDTNQQGLIVEFDEAGKQIRRKSINMTVAYNPGDKSVANARFDVAFKTDDGGVLAFGTLENAKAPTAEKSPDWMSIGMANNPLLLNGVWIVKLDKNLNVTSANRVRGTMVNEGWQTSDGQFVIGGMDAPTNGQTGNADNSITLLRKYSQTGALTKDARPNVREITSFYKFPENDNFVAASPTSILKISAGSGTVALTSSTHLNTLSIPGQGWPFIHSISPSTNNGIFINTSVDYVANVGQDYQNGKIFYRFNASNGVVYKKLSKPATEQYNAPLLLPGNNPIPKYVGVLIRNGVPVPYQLIDNTTPTFTDEGSFPSGTSLKAVSTSDGFFTCGGEGGNAKVAKLSTCVNFIISNPPANNKYTEPFAKTLKINKPINYSGAKASVKADVKYSLVARVNRGTINGKTAGQVLETLNNQVVASFALSGGKGSGKAFDLNRTYTVTSDQAEVGFTIIIHDNYTASGVKQSCDQSYFYTFEGSLYGGTTKGPVKVCYNTAPSQLTVENAGGGSTATYTYQWQQRTSSTGTWTNISGATAATYTPGKLTAETRYRRAIINSGVTQHSTELTIGVHAQVVPTIKQVNVLCHGGATGSITIAGATKYRIYKGTTWSTWATTATYGSLPKGTYKVQAQDANGCESDEKTVTITEPTAALALTLTPASTTGPGKADGKITIKVTGGTSAYQYSKDNVAWTAMASGDLTVTGYAKGTHTIYIKDKNGCTINKNAIVYDALVGGTTKGTTPVCYGSTPTALTVTGSGGGVATTSTYQWQTRADATATWANIGGATAANYTPSKIVATTRYRRSIINSGVTQHSSEFILTVHPQVVVSITKQVNVLCYDGATGSITIAGGTKYRIYKGTTWTTWATTATYGSLPKGTYKVQAQDANGCESDEKTVTITEPAAALALTLTPASTTGPGKADGKITIKVTGGTSAYQYSKDNTAWTTMTSGDLIVTGYAKGTHTIYIKDKNGCTINKNAVVYDALVGGTTKGTTPVCYGSTPTTLTVTGSGGGVATTSTYQWQTRADATATWANIGGATAANYTPSKTVATTRYRRSIINSGVTQHSSEFILTVHPQVVVAATKQVNVLCYDGATGSVEVSGGTKYRIYKNSAWGAWGTATTFGSLAVGTYKVQAQDANGCESDEKSVTITQPTAKLDFTTTATSTSCEQTGGATISVAITGGVSPYQYSKDGTAYTNASGNSATLTGYTAGTHTVYIKDANGCTISKQATVTHTNFPSGDVVATPKYSIDADGNLEVKASFKNTGNAPFANPFYVTIYKNALGNATKHVYTHAKVIVAGATAHIYIKIPNFKTDPNWNGCTNLILNFNDKGNGTRDQTVCNLNIKRGYKLSL